MTIKKSYGEVLDDMDHQAKYQPATVDPCREQELRIQAIGAAISRRDWHATERAYEAIRDKFYVASPPEQPAAIEESHMNENQLANRLYDPPRNSPPQIPLKAIRQASDVRDRSEGRSGRNAVMKNELYIERSKVRGILIGSNVNNEDTKDLLQEIDALTIFTASDFSASAQRTPGAVWRESGLSDPHGTDYDCERAKLALGHLSDDQLANNVFLDPNIVTLTAAKERIRWLSRVLSALTSTHRCPGEDK